jgi:N-acetylneuraminic acid mutarotase
VKSYVVFFLFLFALIGCDKDEEGEAKLVPPTLSIHNVQLNSSEVVFSGEMKDVKGTVAEYGFAWGEQYNPSYESLLIVGGGTTNTKSFSYHMPNYLSPGVQYFVKSYAKIGGKTFYSAKVVFTYITPYISDFSPYYGTPESQLTILGQNFVAGKTTVTVGGLTASIVSIESGRILANVPTNLQRGYHTVTVTVDGASINAWNSFYCTLLRINSIEPLTGTYGDTITITGGGFNTAKDYNYVSIGSQYAQIIESSTDRIKFIVPGSLTSHISSISVSTSYESATSTQSFTLLLPEFTFEPKTGTFGDEIKLNGKHFNPISYNNRIFLGDIEVYLLEATTESLRFQIPPNYSSPDGKAKIRLQIGDMTSESTDEFELALHSVLNVNPLEARRGNEVTITGDKFNPTMSYNEVRVGNYLANVIQSTSSSITFSIPSELSGGDFEVKVRVGGRDVVAPQIIHLTDPWYRKASIPGGARYDAFAFVIDGKGYVGGGFDSNNNYRNDLYSYNPESDTWTRRADIPVNGHGMTSFATSTKGYVLFQKEFWQYDPATNKWSSKADFPGIALSWQSSFALADMGYVGGGINSWGGRNSEFFEYEEATDEWHMKTNYYTEASHGVGFSANGKGYFTFGLWIHRDILEYSTTTNSWADKMSLLDIVQGLYNMRVGAVAISGDTKAYFGTGSNDTYSWGSTTYSDLYEYDAVDNSTRRLTDMPGKGRSGAIGFSINGKIYVGSGRNYSSGTGTASNDFYEYDPGREEE